jgi:hypothetical protein
MRVWNLTELAAIHATVFLTRCSRSDEREITPISASKWNSQGSGEEIWYGGHRGAAFARWQ